MDRRVRERVVKLFIILIFSIILITLLVFSWLAVHRKQSVLTFDEKLDYITSKLEQIRNEVLNENGEETYIYMLKAIDGLIEESSDENIREQYRKQKQKIVDDVNKAELRFYRHNASDIVNTQRHEYVSIPNICTAQGQIWCEITTGLIFAIIDPKIEKVESLYSVSVPKANENTGTMIIPAKYINRAFGKENNPYNKMIYNNAMRYVYKFFEGKITQKQLDDATAEIIEKGQADKTVFNILSMRNELETDSEQLNAMYTRVEKAQFFPDITIEKEYKSKRYIFKYDNSRGNIIIEFPLE